MSGRERRSKASMGTTRASGRRGTWDNRSMIIQLDLAPFTKTKLELVWWYSTGGYTNLVGHPVGTADGS